MTFGSHLQIAISTAHCIYKRFIETGDFVLASKHMPHCSSLDEHHHLLLIAMVIENPI